MGVLGDFGCIGVPDVRVERRHQHQRVVEILTDAVEIGLHLPHTMLFKGEDGIVQQLHRLAQAAADERHEDVEFQMSL